MNDAAIQRFTVGQVVRTRPVRAGGHTRLPRYLAERRGVIERVHGIYPLADERAEGRPEGQAASPQALYAVVFDAREIWSGSNAGVTIAADLWDAYLEEAAP